MNRKGLLLLGIAVVAMPSYASWFGGRDKSKDEPAAPPPAPSESVHRTLSAADGDAFLRLVRARQQIDDQQRVLVSLLDEKRREFAAFGESLRANYGIAQTNTYQYMRDERVLYRIEGLTNAAAGDAPAVATNQVSGAGLKRTLHRNLSGQEAGAFEKLLAAKQITRQQIAALELLRREKQLEHNRAVQTLSERFGIDPARHYRYDARRRTVYLTTVRNQGGDVVESGN